MRKSYSFDLNKALAAWRRSLEHNRTFTADDLDELEQHLRDQVAGLVKQDLSEEAAFSQAMGEMGGYGTAEAEYQKVYWGKLRRRHQLKDELHWRMTMIKNYLKMARRNLLQKKGYAFINIAGLTLGLACCLLIFQYVAYEYSFDAFNENASTLYRITQTTARNGTEVENSALSGYALGPALAEAVPGVVRFARIHPDYDDPIVSNPEQPDKAFEERQVFYADPAFLRMFSYPLVTGDTAQALAEPGTLVLSETAARKYFGQEDPIGKTLQVTGWIQGTFQVNGVLQDTPANSHLQFNMLLPMEDLLQKSSYSDPAAGWNWSNFITYVQLREDAPVPEIERTFTEVLKQNQRVASEETRTTIQLNAQPLRDVYLNEDIFAGRIVPGSYRTVYFFGLIGLITLLIALVNYVNLATARSLDRAREVGVRKVVGAQRRQLIVQFLCESALTNLIAILLAIALATLLRPFVNNLTDVHLPNFLWTDVRFWMVFIVMFGVGTLLAGLYPAFVLSAFKPVSVLKGKAGSFAAHLRLRQGLVVLQFSASIVLVTGTAIIYAQLDYLRHMDLGINLEQILTIASPRVLSDGADNVQVMHTFTDELRQIPAIQQMATSSTVPGQGFKWSSSNLRKETADPSSGESGFYTEIDTSFARLYGLELVAGKGFESISTSPKDAALGLVLASEATVKAVGFDTPAEAVDQLVTLGGATFKIIGVFKDFNWSSAHSEREAVLFGFAEASGQLSLKVQTDNLPQTIAAIKQIYTTLFPGNPFTYSFVDEQFDQQYRRDQQFATLFTLFAGLALAIACLGLFGLAAFAAQQRTKEIGVRKVLGASVSGIVVLLSKNFAKLVCVSFALAVPVAYFFMQRWLEDFAYRIDLGPWVFFLAGVLVLMVALLTVSYQAVKAALADPVKSLRYE